MIWKSLRYFFCLGALADCAGAATYYVSPTGNDGADGLSAATAWATLDKASATPYQPGDQILFERGGTWRGRLSASTNGAAELPILYGAYGDGAKPTFYGSDPLDKQAMTLISGTTYSVAAPLPVGSVLGDGAFLTSAWLKNNRNNDTATNLAYVDANPGSYYWSAGQLYLNVGGDPTLDARMLTAVTRDDVVYSNGKDYVTFDNLVVRETAKYDAGYAFRIDQSLGARILNSEAYAAGKHHFGVINSGEFLAKGLKAAVVMPDQGVGGATALVSYADQNFSNMTSAWDDVEVWDYGTNYPAWYSHGEGLGRITLNNIRSFGASIDMAANTVATNLHVEGAYISLGDATLDGAYLKGANALLSMGQNAIVSHVVIDSFYRTTGSASPLVIIGSGNHISDATITTAPTGQVDTLIIFPRVFSGGNIGDVELERVVVSHPQATPLSITAFPAENVDGHIVGDFNVFSNIQWKYWYTTPEHTFAEWQALTGGDANSIEASSSADFDRDGDADGDDFLTWQRNLGLVQSAGHWQGDAQWDGSIDAADLASWLATWTEPVGCSLPEPSGIGLLAVAAGLLTAIRRAH